MVPPPQEGLSTTALSSRLYSYGQSAPRSLLARQRSPPAEVEPLQQPPGGSPGPALRTRLPVDPSASPSNALAPAEDGNSSAFGDMLASFSVSGKRERCSQPDPTTGTAPLPYNKLSRSHSRKSAGILSTVKLQSEASNGLATSDVRVGMETEEDMRRDPFWFIKMLRTELSDHEFAYMNVADTDGTTWDPYNLKIVPFSEVRFFVPVLQGGTGAPCSCNARCEPSPARGVTEHLPLLLPP